MVADYKLTTCILSNQPGLRCHGETFLWVVYVKGIQILLLNTDLNPEDGTSENERLVVYPKKWFHQFINSLYWVDIIIFNRGVYFSVLPPGGQKYCQITWGGKKVNFKFNIHPWFLINLNIWWFVAKRLFWQYSLLLALCLLSKLRDFFFQVQRFLALLRNILRRVDYILENKCMLICSVSDPDPLQERWSGSE